MHLKSQGKMPNTDKSLLDFPALSSLQCPELQSGKGNRT